MSLGPVMLDVAGKALSDDDRRRLKHPLVGGVILFSRNYESPEQLRLLTAEIHALRTPPLLIAVDHEGGRVQRFREGFTRLPPMRELGMIWDEHPGRARTLAQQTGYVLAAELRAMRRGFQLHPGAGYRFRRQRRDRQTALFTATRRRLPTWRTA